MRQVAKGHSTGAGTGNGISVGGALYLYSSIDSDNRKEMRVKNCVSSFIAFTLLFLVVTTLAMKG